jgi:hypothetical protein
MPTLPLNDARDALEKWGEELTGILTTRGLKRDATLSEAHSGANSMNASCS